MPPQQLLDIYGAAVKLAARYSRRGVRRLSGQKYDNVVVLREVREC